jgi:hypothetical protein
VRRDPKRLDKPKSPNDKLVYFQSSDPGATDYQPADGQALCVGVSPHLVSGAQVHGIANARSFEK